MVLMLVCVDHFSSIKWVFTHREIALTLEPLDNSKRSITIPVSSKEVIYLINLLTVVLQTTHHFNVVMLIPQW